MKYFYKTGETVTYKNKGFTSTLQNILKNETKAIKSLNAPISKTIPEKDLNFASQMKDIRPLHGSMFKNQFIK